ncbi:MAG: hypothetical protein IPK46_12250 [Saprospiraceae bacterium]|nr:hypothetical protein [Saprospiraceae bacterium]
MKPFFSYMLAGLVGGLASVAITQWNKNDDVNLALQQQARLVSQSAPVRAAVTGPDFVNAAKVATAAVVHIYAEESEEQAIANSRKKEILTFLTLMIFLVLIFSTEITTADKMDRDPV